MDSWPFAGARWWKFDFHAHTPHSTDYGRGDETLKKRSPREWLLDYMNKGIDCVAITDHNGGAWVDELKREYAAMQAGRPSGFRELVLFPGVEITVNGSIHLLAILDTEKKTSDIDTLLGQCGYGGGVKGESRSSTGKAFGEVTEQIVAFDGIAIPAHADQGAGLFLQMADGNSLPGILKSPFIYSMEIIAKGYACPELFASCKADWTRIVGSDSHQPSEVGSRYTWIKMGKPCLEGLKLALMDGLLSAKRFDEVGGDPNEFAPFVITSVAINNGKYCGNGSALSLNFCPWLNCIIGGRGSGKSTALEMLRIAMRRDGWLREQLGDQSEVVKAFESFARVPEGRRDRGALTVATVIRVEYLLNGERYRIQWSYDGKVNAIERCDADGEWRVSTGDIPSRFPVSIYSQKQIYEMATRPEALLSIMDEAPEVGFRDWKAEHESKQSQYRSLKAQSRELELRAAEESKLRGELEDVLTKLRLFESGENAQLLKEYQRRRAQSREIEAFENSLAECANGLSAIRLESMTPKLELFGSSPDDETIGSIVREFSAKVESLNDRLEELQTQSAQLATQYKTRIASSRWSSQYTDISRAYDTLVASLSEAGVGNPNEYGLIVQKKQQIETRLGEIEGLKRRIGELARQADDSLSDIDSHRCAISEARRRFLASTLAGNKVVRMELVERGQAIEDLEADFRSLIGREDAAFKDDILSEDHSKGILARLVKGYDQGKFAEMKRNLNDLRTGKGAGAVGKRFSDFIARLTPEVLDSIDLWIPEDSVAVSYSKEDARKGFAPIEQGSPGQKTAAILAFILSHGREPLVLDQPEDDLDNHLIYNLVVEQIRENKTRRQMIVVTHNPNIVVNGDAEFVQTMEYRTGQIVVGESGCLQEASVRRGICDIMEGGRDALKERYRRINIGELYV
jgi:energy-coupling factor transporter ATP-binding protein EcfA2